MSLTLACLLCNSLNYYKCKSYRSLGYSSVNSRGLQLESSIIDDADGAQLQSADLGNRATLSTSRL